MRIVARGALWLSILALAGQVYVHADWIAGLSQYCDYPDECLAGWLPFAFDTASALWLTSVVAGGLAWLLAAGLGMSTPGLARLGLAWAAAFGAFFLTPVSAPTRHGILDIGAMGGLPGLDGRYALSLVLWVAAVAGFAWHSSVDFGRVTATEGPAERRVRPDHVLGVGLVLALTTVGAVHGYAERTSVTTDVSVTSSTRSRYLLEMTGKLDAFPRQRSPLVSPDKLVREGVAACRWLADQPGGDDALGSRATLVAYFQGHPTVSGQWPFKQGRTRLRRSLLLNAWELLCPDVYADHVTFRAAQGD